jgi:tRNA dimethylallyltransferase
MKTLVVVEGPTASGKTKFSIDLAKKLETVIFSADSRQFYREMDIGTAKPTSDEMDEVPHFFIDSHSIFQELTAATYAQQAQLQLSEQFLSHETIVLVGGSGMYVHALCHGLDDIPANPELRRALEQQFRAEGLSPLLIKIRDLDATTYESIDRQNPARVIRALEAMQTSGKPLSQLKKGVPKPQPFRLIRITLNPERAVLYDRINQRVDQMMEKGLLQEAMNLFPHRDLAPLRTVGYSELFEYLEGKVKLAKAVDNIRQHTRNYAKRQLTWLRKNKEARWFDPEISPQLVDDVLNAI